MVRIFFNKTSDEQEEKINYGLLVHELLAKVKHKDQVDEALDTMSYEGIIDKEQKEHLKRDLQKLFQKPQINDWFTTDWEVKTEVPILPKTGELSRLDRVMLKDNQAIIIDFKTGERSPKHQQQVKEYMTLLKAMGNASVEGYLLYTDEADVVSVGF